MTSYTARISGMLVAFAVAVATAGTAVAEDPAGPTTNLAIGTCPALYALGIQGTGECQPVTDGEELTQPLKVEGDPTLPANVVTEEQEDHPLKKRDRRPDD